MMPALETNMFEIESLKAENAKLKAKLDEAEQTLAAIRNGGIDALVVSGDNGVRVFTLQGAEHNYRVLVESIGEGALTATSSGTITYCNSRFAEMVKSPAETIVGKSIAEFVHPSERPRFETFLGESIGRTAKEETLLIGRDGTLIPTQVSLGVLDAEGVDGISMVLTDLTETKMAIKLGHAYASLEQKVDELARSNVELARFAFVASHDLKEPLRVVSNYVQMFEKLHKGKLSDPLSMKCMKFITDSVDRMYSLINDLLSYSRVGATPERLVKIRLDDLFEEVLLNLQDSIQNSKATITKPTLPTIIGDHSHLLQLLQNLVGNALKYRGETPPEIAIDCRRDSSSWWISVSDNGIGIEETDYEKIFGLFYRLHEKTKYSGTGIGLAICKKIVDRMGGVISVESKLGLGSTFSFSIPDGAHAGVDGNA